VVARSAEVTTITIEASAAGDRLILSVHDDGAKHPGSDEVVPGVGLRNTAERLAARFGSNHGFRAARLHPRGFRVDLEMPFRMVSR
jgi:LytS/YehU family sensor histidine kinase